MSYLGTGTNKDSTEKAREWKEEMLAPYLASVTMRVLSLFGPLTKGLPTS